MARRRNRKHDLSKFNIEMANGETFTDVSVRYSKSEKTIYINTLEGEVQRKAANVVSKEELEKEGA